MKYSINKNTIAAVATGRSSAGIGVIRISGNEAIQTADKVFTAVSGKKLCESEGYRAHFGRVSDGNGWEDEAVALVFRAPKSYTGEDVVELSCHGGSAAIALALDACIAAGAFPAAGGEFTRRAFENGKISLTQAEAVMSVISAESRDAAVTAGAVLEGKLHKRIGEAADILKDLATRISAWCDYPDEDEIPEITQESLDIRLNEALAMLNNIYEQGKSAIIVENGVETVICGKPNVGKSTLMNLLSGREKSIVTEIPGTTRDVIDERVTLGSCVLHLYDTAGIRETSNAIENIGIDRAQERIDKAALVLCVLDGSAELDSDDIELLESLQNKTCIGVINKTDIDCRITQQVLKYIALCVEISAKRGTGLDELTLAVEQTLGLDKLDPSMGNIINERQMNCVIRAKECIEQAVADNMSGMTFDAINVLICDGLEYLYELTGERVNEEIVSEIFSKFCVGK